MCYNMHESNEQCQNGQRQIACLQANLELTILIGRKPVNEGTEGSRVAHSAKESFQEFTEGSRVARSAKESFQKFTRKDSKLHTAQREVHFYYVRTTPISPKANPHYRLYRLPGGE